MKREGGLIFYYSCRILGVAYKNTNAYLLTYLGGVYAYRLVIKILLEGSVTVTVTFCEL